MGDVAVLANSGSEGLRLGLVVTAFGFGFRHGIDWDHLAAITDITGSQDTRRRSMFLATLYALGHGLVVFVLGFAAVALSARLPAGVDTVMQRIVGATLLVLGVYVFVALVRHGRDFRMRSRWMLLFAATAGGWRRLRRPTATDIVEIEHDHPHPAEEVHTERARSLLTVGAAGADSPPTGRATHRHTHRHVIASPEDPFLTYGRATAFGVGMIHGIGAETPTQVLIFLAAAGAGGKAAGIGLLVCFLGGLLTSNTLIALASSFGFLGAARNFKVYAGISLLTATFSLVVGSLFLFGRASTLPALFGG